MFARFARFSAQKLGRSIRSVRCAATSSVCAERLKQWNCICSQCNSLDNNKEKGLRAIDILSSAHDCDETCYQLCYINNCLADIDCRVKSGEDIKIVQFPKEVQSMFSRDPELKDFFKTFWHSSAHILGYALEQYYGDKVKLLHGPSGDGIPYCFFYEVTLTSGAPTDKDLKNIQKIINKILKEHIVFEHTTVTKEQAQHLFADNPYKLHIIESATEPISVYKCGNFIDLCHGPHIHSTDAIACLKLISANNVEAKDDTQQHYRFYGNSFVSQEASDYYCKIIKEAKDRDHRLIGKKLDLFMFDGNSPGNVFFLNRGLFIYNRLVNYMKTQYLQNYEEIASPLMFKTDLWKTSGHYYHYKDNMFQVNTNNKEEMFLKPMNCPSHCLIYGSKTHSYRDLPIRYAELTAVHRQENSGALGGLTRLYMFHQDDGHIFCRKDQIATEIENLLSCIESIYSKLDFNYSFVLSTQPSDSVGQTSEWKQTEETLRSILNKHQYHYTVEEGDGAFYAPKIDVLIQDSICRYHQCGTIQLDIQLPKKFGLKYRNADGTYETPVLIHRAIYGSLERFMGVFIEHCNGRFPLYFSPYQVALLPVSDDKHFERCKEVAAQLMKGCNNNIHVDVFNPETSIGKRIRECSMKHYNYMVAIGDEEVSNGLLSIRTRGKKEVVSIPVDQFKHQLEEEIQSFVPK